MNNDTTDKPGTKTGTTASGTTSQQSSDSDKPAGKPTDLDAQRTSVQGNGSAAKENLGATGETRSTPDGSKGSPGKDPGKHASATRRHEFSNGTRRPRPASVSDRPTASRTNGNNADKESKRPEAKIEVEQAEAPQVVDKKSTKSKSQKKQNPIPVDSADTAKGLLEVVEFLSVARFGPNAAFLPEERKGIEEPLARILEKYAPVAGYIGAFVDPALVIMGFAMYGVRIAMTKPEEKQPPKGEFNPEPEIAYGSETPQAPLEYHRRMAGLNR